MTLSGCRVSGVVGCCRGCRATVGLDSVGCRGQGSARQKQAAELATCARAGKCQSGRKAPRPWLTATCTRGQRAVPPAIKCSRCAGPVSRVYARMCAHRPHPRRSTAGCWCSGPRTGCSGRRLERWDHCAACPWPGGAFLPRSGPLRVRPLCAFQAISLAHARRFYFEGGVFPLLFGRWQ